MKKTAIAMVTALAMAILLAGCSTTTVWEYDGAGKCVKKTETETDIAGSIIQSTKDKTVLIWHDGWAGYVSVSPGTFDDPTPHGKMFVGKISDGYFAIHNAHQKLDFDGMAKVVQGAKGKLSISATSDGLTATESASNASETAKSATASESATDLPQK